VAAGRWRIAAMSANPFRVRTIARLRASDPERALKCFFRPSGGLPFHLIFHQSARRANVGYQEQHGRLRMARKSNFSPAVRNDADFRQAVRCALCRRSLTAR
jgi:hypothetical protein